MHLRIKNSLHCYQLYSLPVINYYAKRNLNITLKEVTCGLNKSFSISVLKP